MRHYVDVTDADYERATMGGELGAEKAAQKAAQSERAQTRYESQAEGRAHEKPPVLQGSANSCDTLQYGGMEAAGIEPASRDISVSASTCVVDSLSFARVTPVDRVGHELARNVV